MAIDTVESLLSVFRRVRVLTPEQVDEVARDLQPHYDDPHALADYLVQIDWVTPYQLAMVFDGHWGELLMGNYSLLEPLGEGGVSQVFKAWDTVKGRTVALKVLRQDLARPSDAVRQFQRELQAVTRIAHPNVIKTFDASQVGAVCYFAMEFVEGVDLHRHVAEVGPLPADQAADYVRQVAQGLQAAHQVGLVHRDVKPANLILLNPPRPGATRGPDPVVKIVDWGLARLMPSPHGPARTSEETAKVRGVLIGTADYVAPEQAANAGLVDTRADVYSLGCTFYYLLTGRPPFPGTSLMQKLVQHQEAEPTPIEELRPDLPPGLAALVKKMMAKEPWDRYQIPLAAAVALRPFCPVNPAARVRAGGGGAGGGYLPGGSSHGSSSLGLHSGVHTGGFVPRSGSPSDGPRSTDQTPRPGSVPDLGLPPRP